MKSLSELETYHPAPSPEATRAIRMKRRVRWLSAHWLGVIMVLFGIFNLGAWAAPVLMKAGFSGAANVVYTLYSPLCHQMAQRSYFLFGEKIMYTPEEMGFSSTGNTGSDTLTMRQFRGNSDLGWKVAWSDRMVSMYGGMWLALLLFAFLSRGGREAPSISVFLVPLFILPMVLDGATHMLSDFGGLFEGFRYTNDWLASLTGHALPDSFYAGDVWGSFNSLMRLLTGLLFGFGVVWFVLPYLAKSMQSTMYILDEQLLRASQLYDL